MINSLNNPPLKIKTFFVSGQELECIPVYEKTYRQMNGLQIEETVLFLRENTTMDQKRNGHTMRGS